jgi:hypothetical protein
MRAALFLFLAGLFTVGTIWSNWCAIPAGMWLALAALEGEYRWQDRHGTGEAFRRELERHRHE